MTLPRTTWTDLDASRRAAWVDGLRPPAPDADVAPIVAAVRARGDAALRELRAARRLTGSPVHLPVMADCERGLGRPERAIALAQSPEAEQLDAEGRAELRIVVSGARLDLGQPDAAVIALQGPDLSPTRPEPWHARTFTAYADALRAAGRDGEAQAWEPIVSLLILLATCVGAILLGAKIYQNSLLRMGGRVKLAEALRG